MSELTHFDEHGQAHMVNVGAKDETHRVAVAEGTIRMAPATFELIASGSAKKGAAVPSDFAHTRGGRFRALQGYVQRSLYGDL